VRIADVAAQLITMQDRPINILFTGLRPGEKLHEDLFGAGEQGDRPVHPMISHVPVPALPPEELADLENAHLLDGMLVAPDTTVDPLADDQRQPVRTVSR